MIFISWKIYRWTNLTLCGEKLRTIDLSRKWASRSRKTFGKLEFFVDPFGGAKPRLLRWGKKHRSGSTLSKPRPSGWVVEGLTLNISARGKKKH